MRHKAVPKGWVDAAFLDIITFLKHHMKKRVVALLKSTFFKTLSVEFYCISPSCYLKT